MHQPSLRETTYASIRAWMESGRLPEGSVTSEIELAKQLDMSRTPIRAALQQLETEGFVHIAPKHGVRIVPLSAARVSDLLDIWAALLLFTYEQSKRTKTAALAETASRFLQRLEQAAGETPDAIAAIEGDMWLQWVSLGQNEEVVRQFQTTAAKLRWHRNVRRWKSPYRAETEICLTHLLAAASACSSGESLDFFPYLHMLKQTWH